MNMFILYCFVVWLPGIHTQFASNADLNTQFASNAGLNTQFYLGAI